MHTKLTLLADLRAIGICETDLLTVHTSLKAVGAVDPAGISGGHTVLDALRKSVAEGILMVPAHTYRNIREAPVFHIRETMPCIGTMPGVAVRLANEAYDSGDRTCIRSMQVSHSVVAFGKEAYDFVACDRSVETRTPMAGCYGNLYRQGGKILLLGVDLSKNTFIHVADEVFDYGLDPVTGKAVLPPDCPFTEVTVTDYDGTVGIRRELRTVGPAAADFIRYESNLQEAGAITYGRIGDAPSMLIDARKCFDTVIRVRSQK